MSTPTWGLDPKSRRISVYYTEASTIYEGMPVCYAFDTTDNWLGVSSIDFTSTAGSITESTTTAEGSHNEGKFIRVEDPDADNICAFAGVVAGGDHTGETGPRAIDIYIPNGAVVPVRTDQNCTVGKTVLAVHTAEQFLTAPFEVAGRAIAIAWETVDCATTTGLCLAKLDENMFIYQKGDAVRLEVDDEDAGNMMINQIIVGTSQASGLFSALQIKAYQTAGNAESWDYGLALNVSGDFAGGTITGHANASGHWLNLGAVTISGSSIVSALRAGVYEGGDCTFTSCDKLSALSLAVQVATDPGTGFCQIYCRNDGAQALDAFIIAENAGAMLATACGADEAGHVIGFDGDAVTLKFPVIIDGTTYYVLAGAAVQGVADA